MISLTTPRAIHVDPVPNTFYEKNRSKIVVALLRQALVLEMYTDAYEIATIFINDLIKVEYLPIFDTLFEYLKADTSMFEIKITIIEKLIPAMTNAQAESFMKIIEHSLEETSENSVFRNNLNPLRLGVQLYKIVEDVQKKSGFSEFIATHIKEHINQQVCKILEIYKETDEMKALMDQPDLEGRNCWWYF